MKDDAGTMSSVNVVVRPYEAGDAPSIASVMWRSVREGARADHSEEQVRAWLPEPPAPAAMHRWASDGRHVVVAVVGGTVVGYCDVEAKGHIDHLYCAPEAIGAGVAGALYDAVEAHARAAGCSELFVEASPAARRFFERRGFTVERRQDLVLGGVALHNHAMRRSLDP